MSLMLEPLHSAVLCHAVPYSTILVKFIFGIAERRNGGDSKTEGGKPASVERGRRRVVKQTCISSATSTAGFRQSFQHTTGAMETEETSLSSSPAHTHEESDTNHKESTLHDPDITSTNPSQTREAHVSRDAKQTGRKTRYIAFIGNLPFTATRDDIIENFQKKGIKLTEVRLLTKKGSGESRGCCFVEFSNAKTLQASWSTLLTASDV